MRAGLRLAAGVASWWAALFWLWLLVAGDWSHVELVAAACAATVAATAAVVAQAAAGDATSPDWGCVREAWSVPLAVLLDLGILLAALPRRNVRGSFVVRRVDAASPRRRAWLVLVAGYSPNAYVIDLDEDRGEALLHDLVPRRFSESPVG